MPDHVTMHPQPTRAVERLSYIADSRRPLTILAFLLPAIVFHAIGSILFTRGISLSAERTIGEIFAVFGVFGSHLPSIALVVVLMVSHLMRRDAWRVRAGTLSLMVVESLAWALPLLVLSQVIHATPMASGIAADPTQLGIGARLTIAVGAGLFEETLYRLVLVLLIHAIVADGLALKDRIAWPIAIVASAVVFALVHQLPADSEQSATAIRAFYFIAAVYFGVLFAARGLGIVVAAHILYDVAALV